MTTKYQRPTDIYGGSSLLSNRDKYQQDASQQPRVAISSSKIDSDFNYIIDSLNSIDESSGSRSSIHDRLGVALNEDGTLKASTSLVLDDWIRVDRDLERLSDESITIIGNQTDVLKEGRKVRAIVSATPLYAYVSSVSYDGEKTSVSFNKITDAAGISKAISETPTGFSYSPVFASTEGNAPSLFNELMIHKRVVLENNIGTQYALIIEDDANSMSIQKNTGTESSPVWQTVSTVDANGFTLTSGSITEDKLETSLVTKLNAKADTSYVDTQISNIPAGGSTPAFHVYKNTDQTAAHYTYTTVQFDGTLLDSDSAYDSVNHRFKPQIAGTYFIYARVRLDVNMANEGAVLQIRKNGSGSQVGSHYAESTPPNNSNRDALTISGMVTLNGSTDYVDLCVLQQTGSTQNIQSDSNGDMTSFGGFKVV